MIRCLLFGHKPHEIPFDLQRNMIVGVGTRSLTVCRRCSMTFWRDTDDEPQPSHLKTHEQHYADYDARLTERIREVVRGELMRVKAITFDVREPTKKPAKKKRAAKRSISPTRSPSDA